MILLRIYLFKTCQITRKATKNERMVFKMKSIILMKKQAFLTRSTETITCQILLYLPKKKSILVSGDSDTRHF